MSVKQFLYSIRDEQTEIEELSERIEELEMSLLPGAIRYDKDKVDTSPTDQMSERMASVVDLKTELEKRLTDLNRRKLKAQRIIDTLDDSIKRQILSCYFLTTKRSHTKLEDIGRIIGYSRRQTYRLYDEATPEIEMALNGTDI